MLLKMKKGFQQKHGERKTILKQNTFFIEIIFAYFFVCFQTIVFSNHFVNVFPAYCLFSDQVFVYLQIIRFYDFYFQFESFIWIKGKSASASSIMIRAASVSCIWWSATGSIFTPLLQNLARSRPAMR